MVTNAKGEYYDFKKDVFELPVLGAVTPGRGKNGMFAKESLSFTLLALKCDCADATEVFFFKEEKNIDSMVNVYSHLSFVCFHVLV